MYMHLSFLERLGINYKYDICIADNNILLQPLFQIFVKNIMYVDQWIGI